jgi:hypothetical protein
VKGVRAPGPFTEDLRRLRLVNEKGFDSFSGAEVDKSVGIPATTCYGVGDTVTYYIAERVSGRAIWDLPPSRHCLTVANGITATERTH